MYDYVRFNAWTAAAAAVLLIAGCGGGGSSDSGGSDDADGGDVPTITNPPQEQVNLTLKTLSSRPDIVSGGDTLLQVVVPAGKDPGKVRVLLNGTDVTAKFVTQTDGSLTGLLDGTEPRYTLRAGANTVVAQYDGAESGALSVTNYPIGGPIFSGPQEQPFVCETNSFVLPSGATLGAPTDPVLCAAPTRVEYAYWSTLDRRFIFLPNPVITPADAEEIMVGGRRIPMVVRIETGTINRAIYQTAMLHDPASEENAPTPFEAPTGWNRKLVYTFGGGCSRGWHRQGDSAGSTSWYYDQNNDLQRADSILDYQLIKRGYAVASSSLNVFGQNCNEVLAAESMAMVKERFIEAYGVPEFTIGWGCSGGAYQLHHIADNYPGLLDGLLVGCSYPEVSFTTVNFVTDARLLNRYFRGDYFAAPALGDDAKRAISGLVGLSTLSRMDDLAADRIVPTNCPSVLSSPLRYDLATRPDGARCDLYDHTVNVWGTKPNPLAPNAKPIARRPLDNTGVQYGLSALRSGAIDVDQFLDMNEKIGGFDSDGRPTAISGAIPAPRSVADPETLPIAYASGRMLYTGWGLKDVPIIDYRLYEDDSVQGAYHLRHHSFIVRERLKKTAGDADNQVMLLEGNAKWTFSSESALVLHALDRMDEWLTSIGADAAAGTPRQKVVRNKPAALLEGCVPRGQPYSPASFIAETMSPTAGTCAAAYPVGPGTRAAAGEPPAADIVKCRLKSVATAIADGDYGTTVLGPGQLARLEAIFPDGVCDWAQPGVGQPTESGYRTLSPWQFFD